VWPESDGVIAMPYQEPIILIRVGAITIYIDITSNDNMGNCHGSDNSIKVDENDTDLFILNWTIIVRNKNSLNAASYAIRGVWHDGRAKTLYMHRIIMERKLGRSLHPDERVDHCNNNGLDNSRKNLRLSTQRENMYNRRAACCMNGKPKTSLFKGVSWNKRRSKWRSRIHVNGVEKTIGHFDVEEDAAKAYDAIAVVEYGEFCSLNFPRVAL
jgi:hypothetical protein